MNVGEEGFSVTMRIVADKIVSMQGAVKLRFYEVLRRREGLRRL